MGRHASPRPTSTTSRRTALVAGAAVLVVLAGLPVLFRLFPGLTDTSVLNMPLPWVLLAFAVYPFLFLCGWVYVRRAERNERDFEAVLAPSAPDEDQP